MRSVRRSGVDRNAATWTEGASLLRIRRAEEREASEERIGHGTDDGTARSASVNLARERGRGEQHTDTRCTNGTSEPNRVGRDRSLQSGDLRDDQTGSGVRIGRDIRRTGRIGAFEGSGATGKKRETTTNPLGKLLSDIRNGAGEGGESVRRSADVRVGTRERITVANRADG